MAGLFEGDGHIYLSKIGSKVQTYSLSITFNIKDLPLAEHLKDVIGFGWIRIKEAENACVLTFHTLDGIIHVVSLMNSYLRTPKLSKFNLLIDRINEKENFNIKKYGANTGELNSDSWLAGFLDAAGSFGITNDKKEIDENGVTIRKRKVSCRLIIEQRILDPITNENYEPLFQKIAAFWKVNLNVVKRSKGQEYLNISAKSRESLSIIKGYINQYPLFSSKFLDFQDWEKVVELILSQTHYQEENSVLIEELKKGMNNGRKTFNWDHLNKLGKEKNLVVYKYIKFDPNVSDFPIQSKGRKESNALSSEDFQFSLFFTNMKSICIFFYTNLYISVYCLPMYSGERKESGVSKNEDLHKDLLNKNNTDLNSYLAGLFEGDGHIWIPKPNLKKRHNPRFCITFNLKDEPLANKLLENIGFGHIRYKTEDNACVLIVSPVKGLKKIIALINGELRTPKIHQLHSLIDWMNNNHNSGIKKLPLNKGSIFKDSWLAGFIDADGGFSIQHTKKENAKKSKISCRLRIEQRMIDPVTNQSYFGVLTEIASFLNCNLLTRKQSSTGNEYYTLSASSRKSLQIILDYFECFPLYSSKYLDYKDWAKAVKWILTDQHYTDEGIIEIDSLKNNMNRKRIYFQWEHLNNLK